MLLLEVGAIDDLVDFLHAVAKGDFVRKVRSEHERFRTDPLDGIGERFFIAFTADENATAFKIVFGFVLQVQTAVFKFSFEPVDDDRYPRGAAFEEAYTQLGKLIEHAFHDHSSCGDRQRKGHAERARCRKNSETVEPQIA